MVKLTAELIEQSAQFTNPLKDRELDLRGYKIPVIENMGATLDQFDTIDFSDNDVRKLDGFPLLKRLMCLLMNNNRVVRIAEGLEESIPNLETLVLTNNGLQELGDLDPLTALKSLKYLSLMRNPVTTKKHYRLYLIHKVPSLRVIDFQRIKQKERDASHKMFKGKKGEALSQDIGKKSKTFVPGEKLPERKMEDMAAIKAAIVNAKTLEEVERLNNMLKADQIPGRSNNKQSAGQDEEEMEMNGT